METEVVESPMETKGSVMEDADTVDNLEPRVIASQGNIIQQDVFDFNTEAGEVNNDTYINIKQPMDLKLLWHQKLGHISMSRIDRLANLGYLPSLLARCPHPICQACLYGKMTRRP